MAEAVVFTGVTDTDEFVRAVFFEIDEVVAVVVVLVVVSVAFVSVVAAVTVVFLAVVTAFPVVFLVSEIIPEPLKLSSGFFISDEKCQAPMPTITAAHSPETA